MFGGGVVFNCINVHLTLWRFLGDSLTLAQHTTDRSTVAAITRVGRVDIRATEAQKVGVGTRASCAGPIVAALRCEVKRTRPQIATAG